MGHTALHHDCDAALQVLESRIQAEPIKHRLRRDVGKHERALQVRSLQALQSMIVVAKAGIDKCQVYRRDPWPLRKFFQQLSRRPRLPTYSEHVSEGRLLGHIWI